MREKVIEKKKNRTDRKLRQNGKSPALDETISLYLNLMIAIGKGKRKAAVPIKKNSVGNFARLVDAVLLARFWTILFFCCKNLIKYGDCICLAVLSMSPS